MEARLAHRMRTLTMLVGCLGVLGLLISASAEAQFKGRNGRIFYISTDTSGNQRVFSSTAAGKRRKVISPSWLDPYSVAVSPNGRRVAISGGPRDQAGEWIYLGNSAGGRLRKLVQGSDAGFSPNGRRIVYVKRTKVGLLDRYEIRSVGVGGKGRKLLLDPPERWLRDTRFTPDGKRIIFVATPDPNVGTYDLEVYSIRADTGGGEKQITDDGGFDIDYSSPDVSPNGKRLAVAAYDGFTDRRSIVSLPIGGGPIDIIASPPSDQYSYSAPMYSPDGKRMLVERRDLAFDEYYLIFQSRLTGAIPNQSLREPLLRVPSPSASSFGAFGPVWAARRR